MAESVKIRKIFISNFRSFALRDRKLGPNIKQLSSINIFVGPNGVGKTNLFSAIRDCIDWKIFNSQGTGTISLNYNDRSQPIEIDVSVETTNGGRTAYLVRDAQVGDRQPEDKRDPDPKQDDFFQQWIFPLGFFRQFKVFHASERENEYELIKQNWDKICDDASRIKLNLTDIPKPPGCNIGRESDGFFWDIPDKYGVPIIEGSDGKAGFLFLIVSIRIRRPGSVLLIEEPEIGMHPRLQKQFLNYLKYLAEKDKYQFLINTHSPYLMNFAVADETEEVAVFRMSKDEGYTQIIPAENSRAKNWEILTDLGHSPADVLQASCIIWVEGPSDRIYLKHWLTEYDRDLEEGLHYSIMFYGGRLLSHLSFDDEDVTEFINLLKINPNAAIVIDSDKKKEGDEINPTKCRLCREFDNENTPGFAWVSDGREIENYVLPELMEEAVKNVHPKAVRLDSTEKYDHCYHFYKENDEEPEKKVDKVGIARQVAQFDAKFDRFDLRKRIHDTTNFIRQCNNLPIR